MTSDQLKSRFERLVARKCPPEGRDAFVRDLDARVDSMKQGEEAEDDRTAAIRELAGLCGRWADELREPALLVRKAACLLPMSGSTYVYLLPEHPGIAAVLTDSIDDFDRIKEAFDSWDVLPVDEVELGNRPWVKVAHSETLQRAGQLLNFFPGQYFDGVPNAASPLAAVLTSSLLGAGVGYGAGRMFRKTTPDGYGDNLPRTGLLAGAALGAMPGLLYAYGNHEAGKGMLEPGITSPLVDSTSVLTPGAHDPDLATGLPKWLMSPAIKGTRMMVKGSAAKEAAYDFSDFGIPVSRVGQTLWSNGATPDQGAVTMGTLYAAQQLPDEDSHPDWVTGRQLGRLALNAVGDYSRGILAGHAINAIVGTPHPASTFGGAAVVTGLLGSVASSIFGGKPLGG